MLSYFRLNDPYRILGLLVVLLLCYLPFLIDLPPLTLPELKSIVVGEKVLNGFTPYAELVDDTAPLTAYLYAVMDFFFGSNLLARHIIAAIFIFIQAVFLGIIFIDKKIYSESSFIPSLIYGLLFTFSFDSFALSGELVGIFFLLLALNSLFKELEFREQSLEMVLKTGFYIGVASLFSFSFTVYVVASLVVLFLFTRSSGRKFGLLVTGYLLPHILLIALYSISNSAQDLWDYFYVPNFTFEHSNYISIGGLFKTLLVPLSFLVMALIFVNRESRFTKYQSQILQAMFFWMIFCFAQVFLSREFRPQSLIALITPLAFFISHFLLLIRRRLLAEIAFWVLLAGTLTVNLNARYRGLPTEAYQRLVLPESNSEIKNKKLFTLNDDWSLYKDNSMTTPFVSWPLAKEIFEHPEFYENVMLVYSGFKADPPEVIVDPQNLMKPFLEKIPELRNQYTTNTKGYLLRK